MHRKRFYNSIKLIYKVITNMVRSHKKIRILKLDVLNEFQQFNIDFKNAVKHSDKLLPSH